MENNNTNNQTTYNVTITAHVIVDQLHNPLPEIGGLFGPFVHSHNFDSILTYGSSVTVSGNIPPNNLPD